MKRRKSSYCKYVHLGSWKWRAVHIYGGRHHRTRGCHPRCVYPWQKWVSQTLLKTPCEKISSKLFQAHDQKNPCPAGEGQCLGEHSSKHQQNCSPPTQSTSMAGVVKRIGNLPPLENYSEVLISMFVWVVCFWRGTVPWWTYQWTSPELLPTNSINLHGWCGEEKKWPCSKTTQKCWCLLFVWVVFFFHYSVISSILMCLV